MGTLRRLAPAAGDVTLALVAEAYLATLRGAAGLGSRPPVGITHGPVTVALGACWWHE